MNTNGPKYKVRFKALSRRQWIGGAVTAIIAVVFAVALMTALNRLLSEPAPGDAAAPASTQATPAEAPAVPKIKATLFFGSEDGLHLVPTEREVPLAEGAVAQARSILEALLAAEAPPPLVSTIPKGVTLRGIFVSERNEVFVDLDPSIRTSHAGGTQQELMTVYTIVNTLLTNLPGLQEVQILVGGQEVDTLAGHVDLRRPLKKNDSLVVGSTQ